jgi:phosphatidylglycerophosphate synthase
MNNETVGTLHLDRRPLASRSTGRARWLAERLTRSRITPDQISVLSVAWAALGGASLFWAAGWPAFVVTAVCVDGMVAIEAGKSTPAGALFNEMLDPLADARFLVPLGYAGGDPWLG